GERRRGERHVACDQLGLWRTALVERASLIRAKGLVSDIQGYACRAAGDDAVRGLIGKSILADKAGIGRVAKAAIRVQLKTRGISGRAYQDGTESFSIRREVVDQYVIG